LLKTVLNPYFIGFSGLGEKLKLAYDIDLAGFSGLINFLTLN